MANADTHYVYIPQHKLFVKRVFDIAASLFGITVLFPVLAVIALCVGLSSTGGVLFRQVRVGRQGKEFKVLKFRTMISGAPAAGPQITAIGDLRVTKVGGILRKTKLDELPQLFNVLFGDMSFVGPRPEVPKYVEMYSEEQRAVLSIRPGITDPASIRFRDESEILAGSKDPEKMYIEEIMPAKLSLNLAYLQNIGLFGDIKIIFATFARIIKS